MPETLPPEEIAAQKAAADDAAKKKADEEAAKKASGQTNDAANDLKKEQEKLAKEKDELQKELDKLKAEKAEDENKKKEAEMTAQELVAKKELENQQLRAEKLVTDVRQDLGYTHKIFKTLNIQAKDGESLTEELVKSQLESFKATLDDYYEKHVKPVNSPGGSAPGNKATEKGNKTEPVKSAAERLFGVKKPA